MKDSDLVKGAILMLYLGIETATQNDSPIADLFATVGTLTLAFVGIKATYHQIMSFRAAGKKAAKIVNITARKARLIIITDKAIIRIDTR